MSKSLAKVFVILFFVTLASIIIIGRQINPMPSLEKKPIIYPIQSVTMIVPSVPGGGMDLQARSLEALFKKHFDEGLLIMNRPGGSCTIGWNELVNSTPDGYTLGIGASDLILHALVSDGKYHYPSALDPIAQISSLPLVLVVNAASPHKNLKELIAYAKENSYNFKFGHPGLATSNCILGKVLESTIGITFDYVPFKGGSEISAALLGNHVEIAFIAPSTVKEQIRAGTLKAVAITGEKRLADPALSNIPTLEELDLNIVFYDWFCVASPKPLPPEVKEKLEKGFAKIVADPEFKRNMDNLGLEIEYLNSDDSVKKWVKESRKLKKWLTETGVLEQIEREREQAKGKS